jgi:hypothetical protein
VIRGDLRLDGRASRSRGAGGGGADLRAALAASRAVARRARPERSLSLSPGLFGQVFRAYAECAMGRLSFFGERARAYRAPRRSAPALPGGAPPVRKAVRGISTRFAVANPFDPRVLAAFSPPAAAAVAPPGTPGHPPSAAWPAGPNPPGGAARWIPATSPGGGGAESTRRAGTPAGAQGSPGGSSARASTPSQAGAPDYREQARAIRPGLLQGLPGAPAGCVRGAGGGPGTVALQAVRRHQVTAAGHTNRQSVLKIFCSIYITKFLG